MSDVWDITVSNRTGSKVDVMIFQTMSDPFIYGSYFAAWMVGKTQNPGNIRLELSDKFDFYVIDYSEEDERQTGPFKVQYGDEVVVLQLNAANSPIVTINSDKNILKDRIKVISLGGNAQPLEMALFKKRSKMVFYKNIVPNSFVFMAIKPSVYMSIVHELVKPGHEFLASSFIDEKVVLKPYHIDHLVDEEDARPVSAESNGSNGTVECDVNNQTACYSKATHINEIMGGYSIPVEFQLREDIRTIEIQITQKKSGEYEFKPELVSKVS